MATLKDKLTFAGAGTQRAAGRGRFFLIVAAASPVTIRCRQPNKGAGIVIENVGVCRIGPVGEDSAWEEVTIQSAAAQIVEYINGDDPVDFPNAVSIAGDVVTQERPSAALTSQAKTALATANNVDIAANLLRKAIVIQNWSDSAGNFCVRDQAGTTDAGEEIQAGMGRRFAVTGALRIRNNSGVSVNYSWNEEA